MANKAEENKLAKNEKKKQLGRLTLSKIRHYICTSNGIL